MDILPFPDRIKIMKTENNEQINKEHYSKSGEDFLNEIKVLRTTIVDLNKSNEKLTIIIGMFALLQIFIAGLQLTLAITESYDKVFAVFVALIFIIILFYFGKKLKWP